MNDSPFSYDMLQSLAVQVSQELYRETFVDSTQSDLSYRDVLAGMRTRLTAWRHRFQMICAPLSHAATGTVEQIRS